MSNHTLGVIVVLQYFVFCWGTALLFCGISGALNDGVSVKAVTLGFTLLIGTVASITVTGNAAERVASPISTVLIVVVLGIWTGVRSWKALELAAIRKSKKTKAIPHD